MPSNQEMQWKQVPTDNVPNMDKNANTSIERADTLLSPHPPISHLSTATTVVPSFEIPSVNRDIQGIVGADISNTALMNPEWYEYPHQQLDPSTSFDFSSPTVMDSSNLMNDWSMLDNFLALHIPPVPSSTDITFSAAMGEPLSLPEALAASVDLPKVSPLPSPPGNVTFNPRSVVKPSSRKRARDQLDENQILPDRLRARKCSRSS